MTAARVRVMAFRQEQEGPPCRLRILFRRVAPQSMETVPVGRLLGLLLSFLTLCLSQSQEVQVMGYHADASIGRLDAAAKHTSPFIAGFAEFLPRLGTDLFPVRDAFGSVSVPSCSRPR